MPFKPIVELTGTPHTHVCEDSAAASRAQTIFGERSKTVADKLLASEASFGGKIWRAKRAFGTVFFLNCGAIPPQKCQKSPQTGGGGGDEKHFQIPPPPTHTHQTGGWGISSCLVKKQSEMPNNFVCNSNIIPKNISTCGAIAKKNHTQNIYNLDTITAAGLRAILN